MAFVDTGEVWTVVVGTGYNGQSGLNTTHWEVGSTTGGGIPDTLLASTLDAALAPLYKALMTDAALYYGVKVFRKYPKATAVPVVADNNTGGGTAGSNALPTAVRGLLALKTSTIGKKGRGRLYLPFPDSADISGAEPTSSYVTRATALGTYLTTDLIITSGGLMSGLSLVVAPKGAVSTWYTVVSALGEQKWGTQHRSGDFGRLNPFPPFTP